MRQKRRAVRKSTKTEALEKRLAELEKRLPPRKSSFLEHLKTIGTGLAMASAIYARKDPTEILTLARERLLMP